MHALARADGIAGGLEWWAAIDEHRLTLVKKPSRYWAKILAGLPDWAALGEIRRLALATRAIWADTHIWASESVGPLGGRIKFGHNQRKWLTDNVGRTP